MFSVCFVVLLLLPCILGVLSPMGRKQLIPVRIKSSQRRSRPDHPGTASA